MRRKSRTLTGKRIPIDIYNAAKRLQKMAAKTGKKISLQESYRKIARMVRI